MKEKKNFDKLFVASSVYHLEVETKPWIQYESFGEIEHRIFVSSRKVLVYGIEENGQMKYYLYPSGIEVKETNFDCSYKTESSCFGSIYSSFICGEAPIPVGGIRQMAKEKFKKDTSLVGYFIPVSDYLGVSDRMPIELVHALVRLSNLRKNKKAFPLSFDREEALKQLRGIGYSKEEKGHKKLLV